MNPEYVYNDDYYSDEQDFLDYEEHGLAVWRYLKDNLRSKGRKRILMIHVENDITNENQTTNMNTPL